MGFNTIEPSGVDKCERCSEEKELLTDTEEELCLRCIHKKYGDDFLKNWVIGAGLALEDGEKRGKAIFELGFGLSIEFDMMYTEMPTSRTPGGIQTEYVLQTESNTATIRYKGDVLGEVISSEWARYAEDYLRD